MKSIPFLHLTVIATPVAARVYAGFNYGPFWSGQSNVKRYADFHHGFELAKNLTDTPVPFDTARLYTCITAGTQNDPTEAFQAAIDTGTNLLLGMWVSPGATGQPNDALVDNELAALGKGFEQHGQKLADLVIGLSIGNEDIYRFNSQQAGVGPDDMFTSINRVKTTIKASPWGKYMEGKPIGHTDTAMYAAIPGSDFVGMTAYPYWEGQSIDNANATFMSILKDTQRRAGNTSVWISEAGWPINGTKIKDAVASADNYQRFWNEVGCQVFGKYNTFWFELLQDSVPDQPDWGLLDTKTYQPRIRDLSCGGRSDVILPVTSNFPGASNTFLSQSEPTTILTAHSSVLAPASGTPARTSLLAIPTFSPASLALTVHTTETRTTTVHPTSLATVSDAKKLPVFLTATNYVSAMPTSDATLPHNPTDGSDKITACIVMMDPLGDGVFMPVITYAADLSTCTPPPQFTGSPFTMIADPTAAPNSTAQISSFDLWAPSTTSTGPTTTAIQSNGPTCATSAGVTYEAVILNGQMYTGKPTPSCAFDKPAVAVPTTHASNALNASNAPASALTVASSVSLPLPLTTLTSSSLKTLFPTTLLTLTTPVPPSYPASTPAAPPSTTPSPPPTALFSPPRPTFPPHAPITPPPAPPPSSTATPLCTDGALVCTTIHSHGWLARIISGYPRIIQREGEPVPCSSSNDCTWLSAAAATRTAASEGDVTCLKHGVQARISEGMLWVLSPPVPCKATPAPTASEAFDAGKFFGGVGEE
ncbi:glycoside hydrolase family 17 protein [Didymella exigua CBS 183.55]|uniref:glucan endo-1,3-beta-D-glucosidase n=1 Tax=Didymella exigua CBS 183.55 TaxID=1150837 RepID=A0A6A5RJ60_9PLEO|nr:glycoside hydrolase family 17 protein [Didymella exigua CBS 183.55]KAF1927290.1 glycoside hydrolase family 17 protein [Didymella exigua CBS 183.55]